MTTYAAAIQAKDGVWRRVAIDTNGTVRWYAKRYRGSFTPRQVARVKAFALRNGNGRVRLTVLNPYPNLVGDLDAAPELLTRLQRVAKSLSVTIRVREGRRTRAEQEVFYNRYLYHDGPLAARPGTSRHETGMAADCGINGLDIGDYPGAVNALKHYGLGLPVPGEDWHVEISSSMAGAAS